MDRLHDVAWTIYTWLEPAKGSRSPIPVLLVIARRNQCSEVVETRSHLVVLLTNVFF